MHSLGGKTIKRTSCLFYKGKKKKNTLHKKKKEKRIYLDDIDLPKRGLLKQTRVSGSFTSICDDTKTPMVFSK